MGIRVLLKVAFGKCPFIDRVVHRFSCINFKAQLRVPVVQVIYVPQVISGQLGLYEMAKLLYR